MRVTLDIADAMELEQLLDFLADWMKSDHDYLALSLACFLWFLDEWVSSSPDEIGESLASFMGACRVPKPRHGF